MLTCQPMENNMETELRHTLHQMIHIEKFQSPETHIRLFKLLQAIYEEGRDTCKPTPTGMIAPTFIKTRKTQDSPNFEVVGRIVEEFGVAKHLSPFLGDKAPALAANAAALLMIITNDFVSERIRDVVAQASTEVLIKRITDQVPAVQYWCIGLLRNLARSDDVVKRIGELNGIRPLIDVLDSDGPSVGIASSALANVVYDNNENRDLVASYGGIEKLINVIRTRTKHTVLWEATGALGNLSYRSEPNKQRIIDGGGLKLLMKLLFHESEYVVASTSSTLENLCSNDEQCRLACASLGAIPRFIELLNSTNESILDGASGVLFNLSINVECRSEIFNSGALPRVIQLLDSPNEEVQYRASGVLHNLSCGNESISKALSPDQGLRRIVQLLSSPNGLIKENATGTVMNLACKDEKAIELCSLGAVESLLCVLKVIPRDTDEALSYRACGALFNLCYVYDAAIRTMVDSDGAGTLINLLKYSSNQRVREYGLGCFAIMMAFESSVCTTFCKLKGLELISQMMGPSNAIPTRLLAEISSVIGHLLSHPDVVMIYGMIPFVLKLQKHPDPSIQEMADAQFDVLVDSMSTVSVAIDQPEDLSGFESLLNSELFHDVVLIVNGARFYAHKPILFGRSSYFRALFERWLSMPSNNVKELPVVTDAPPEVFLELLRYVYSGTCHFTEDNVALILELADLYNFTRLTNLAEVALWERVSPENVIDFLALATRYNAHKLKTALAGFALRHLSLIPPEHLELFSFN